MFFSTGNLENKAKLDVAAEKKIKTQDTEMNFFIFRFFDFLFVFFSSDFTEKLLKITSFDFVLYPFNVLFNSEI